MFFYLFKGTAEIRKFFSLHITLKQEVEHLSQGRKFLQLILYQFITGKKHFHHDFSILFYII